MKLADRKFNTHIVFKVSDANKYLREDEKNMLGSLLHKINIGRRNDHKKVNTYHVCNEDEPYSNKVLHEILMGEMEKVLQRKEHL